LTGDERLPLTVRVSLRICEKPSVGMKLGRDDCLLSRIMRAAGRQDDGSAMREPGQQQPQKQKVSKMIDCKGCLEPVGAAGVIISKQRAGIQYQGIDLSRPEFRIQRRNEGSHVLQAHQVERKCSRSRRPKRRTVNAQRRTVFQNF
jgi:hypothetical protein